MKPYAYLKKDELVCADCKKTFPPSTPYLEMLDHINSDRVARRPSEMLACVRIQCVNNDCMFYGKEIGSDIYLLKDKLVVEWHHDSPMCEHMWEKAKAFIDWELKDYKGEVPAEERLNKWWCPYCLTRIPRNSERCPNCNADFSKLPSYAEYNM